MVGVSEHPALSCTLVDIEAALAEERKAQVPGSGLNNESHLEMPSFEIVLRLALQLLGNGIYMLS